METQTLLFAVLASVPAYAGVTVVTQGDGPEKHASTMYLDGIKMRMESEKHAMIFDGDAQAMTEVNHEKKTYTTMTRAEMKKMMGNAQQKMQEHMSQMTPEQRQ